MSVNAFIHTANILLLVAYSVTDLLWLRVFAVASSVIALPYFMLQPTPQRAPIAWTVVFAVINSFQAYRLYLQRRPVTLTGEEEDIRRLAFPDLAPRTFLEVFSLGSLDSVPDGERMLVGRQTCRITVAHRPRAGGSDEESARPRRTRRRRSRRIGAADDGRYR